MPETIYTVGHSNHRIEHFVQLLSDYNITALCDVRSKPYSRVNPQFSREALKMSLKPFGITYVFLGKELGARSEDDSCYANGKVIFDRLAKTTLFKTGIDRIDQGVKRYNIAMMCAEKDPIECHRTILVARQLELSGYCVKHILPDGRNEDHCQTMDRLMRSLGLAKDDLFWPRETVEAEAYRIQSERIAYIKFNSRNDEKHGEIR